jgi:hypothetical protein
VTYTANSSTPYTAIAGTVETLAIASPSYTPFAGAAGEASGPYFGYAIRGMLNVTAGTSATSLLWQIRQGSSGTTGTVIAAGTQISIALDRYNIPCFGLDTGALPQSQYALTITQPANTGGGVINYAYIETDIVSP